MADPYASLAQQEAALAHLRPTITERLARFLEYKVWPSLPALSRRDPARMEARFASATDRHGNITQPDSAPDRIVSEPAHHVHMVVPRYPWKPTAYGGQFHRTRAQAYRDLGVSTDVFVCPPYATEGMEVREAVTRGGFADLTRWAAERGGAFSLHSPSPRTLAAILEGRPDARILCTFHGAEARDPARLAYNYTPISHRAEARLLAKSHAIRMAFLRTLATDSSVEIAFVSETLRNMAEEDSGADLSRAHILPNPIDTALFHPREHDATALRRILAIRPFSRLNYGGDVLEASLSQLARQGAEVTLVGFGLGWMDARKRLSGVAGLTLIDGPVPPSRIAELHATHGIFIYPTRHDTQGVSLCEAVASGMVAVTNRGTATEEFVGQGAVWLDTLDPSAFVEAALRVHTDPAAFRGVAEAGAARIAQVCGPDETVRKDLAILLPGWQGAPQPLS